MSIESIQVVEQQLIEYLGIYVDGYDALDANTDLIEQGILDSLLVTDLILLAQTRFGVEFTPRDITPENFGNVERIARLIDDKQSKLRRAA